MEQKKEHKKKRKKEQPNKQTNEYIREYLDDLQKRGISTVVIDLQQIIGTTEKYITRKIARRMT